MMAVERKGRALKCNLRRKDEERGKKRRKLGDGELGSAGQKRMRPSSTKARG
jgi:hypothetical protein